MDYNQLAEIAWLGLNEEEVNECGPGPLSKGLYYKDDVIPYRLLDTISNPEYFPLLTKNIFNIEIMPIQHTVLKELWEHRFPMLIGSRGFGKTFILALYAMIRSLLLPGRKIVIAGAAFRQSKFVFEYCENIWYNAPVLRDICKGSKGPRRDIDRCEFTLGRSKMIFVPLGDGSKIRGLRANDVMADEFASLTEEIFEVVLAGFGTVSSSPIHNVKINAKRKYLKRYNKWSDTQENFFQNRIGNQLIISGTAYYRFNHFYKYWKRYSDIIRTKGDKEKLQEIINDVIIDNFNHEDYSVIRIPHSLLPEGFMDSQIIARQKATIHSSHFMMEFGAIFPEDSNGFFSRKLIESCIANHKNNILLKSGNIIYEAALSGSLNKKYIYGIDPASEKDNFSIIILEQNDDHVRVVYCWTTTRKRHKEKIEKKTTSELDFYSYCCRKIRDLMNVFPTEHIGIDSEGGGRAIEEGLHDLDKIKEGEYPIWPIMGTNEYTDGKAGKHILHMINFSSAEWVSNANHGLKKDLEDKAILFPANSSASFGIAAELDGSTPDSDSLEDCMFEIEELKDELSTIMHTQTGIAMRDRWDTPEIKLPGNRKGKQRKDRYTALLIANMIARTITRTEPEGNYRSGGGFALDMVSSTSEEKMYEVAPDWFKSWANDVYNH